MGEKKKKVLMLLGSFGMGGAEHMVYELIKNLPPNEIDASVLCYGEKRHTPLEEKVEKICSVEYLNFGNQIGLREMFLSIRHIAKLHPDIRPWRVLQEVEVKMACMLLEGLYLRL